MVSEITSYCSASTDWMGHFTINISQWRVGHFGYSSRHAKKSRLDCSLNLWRSARNRPAAVAVTDCTTSWLKHDPCKCGWQGVNTLEIEEVRRANNYNVRIPLILSWAEENDDINSACRLCNVCANPRHFWQQRRVDLTMCTKLYHHWGLHINDTGVKIMYFGGKKSVTSLFNMSHFSISCYFF